MGMADVQQPSPRATPRSWCWGAPAVANAASCGRVTYHYRVSGRYGGKFYSGFRCTIIRDGDDSYRDLCRRGHMHIFFSASLGQFASMKADARTRTGDPFITSSPFAGLLR